MALNGEDENGLGTAALKHWLKLWTLVPEPVRAIDQPFLLPIEDVFSISGRYCSNRPLSVVSLKLVKKLKHRYP